MKNYITVYTNVHKNSLKIYIFTLLLSPALLSIAFTYINLLQGLLGEHSSFYILAVLGIPVFLSALLFYVNYKVVQKYKEQHPQVKVPSWILFIVGHGLSYLLISIILVVVASILIYIIG